MKNGISCSSIIAIAITLSALIFLIHSYSTQDELAAKFAKERAEADSAKKELSDEFKNQYNFNIDSLIPKIKVRKSLESIKPIKSPLIVYRQWKDGVYFDDDFMKLLPRHLTSFASDSINTIVLLDKEVINVGGYQNNKTAAYQHQVTVNFIDFKKMKEINSVILKGGSPPSRVSYRRRAPEAEYGSEVSQDEIIETIMKELNYKEHQ